MFAQRLDFLMELTNTQASALGRACLLDASHISRLRNGSRPLPKKPAFLPAMSLYLTKRVRADYQKSILCEMLRLGSWPMDEKQGAALIERMLLEDTACAPDVEPILSSFTMKRPYAGPQAGDGPKLPQPKSYYYGPEGKREAVLQFFDMILKEGPPQILLLSSEEEMSWLYDDPQFAARWAADFTRVLRAGNRVRIIHSLGRSLYELIEAVAKWIPIYMTGMIEPYYYPKLRDEVSQRTVFLAPKTAAVVSSSVTRRTDGMLNTLITDKEALAALEKEFENYLSLCRPLMRIITARRPGELWETWGVLARADGDLICMSGTPTLATMPEGVARAMQARAPESRILELRDAAAANLKKLLEAYSYTELLPEGGGEGPTELPCADFLSAPGLCYTKDELAAHRDNARAMAERYERFKIVERNDIPQNLLLYGRESRGVIVAKTDAPGTAFAISEPALTNAFLDYLERKAT